MRIILRERPVFIVLPAVIVQMMLLSSWNGGMSEAFTNRNIVPSSSQLWMTPPEIQNSSSKRPTRKHRRTRLLPQERRQQLAELFDIHWPSLQQFYETHRHSRVSNKQQQQEELYLFTKYLRRNQQWLNPQQRQLLENIQFPFHLQKYAWEYHYQLLLDFKKRHGHCRVPIKVPKLGTWVRNQRREFKKYQHNLPSTLTVDQRLQRLEAIGFSWYRSHETAWNLKYQQLQQYHQKHGHCHVPQPQPSHPSHPSHPPPATATHASSTSDSMELTHELGNWCMNQRREYKKWQQGQSTALDTERIQKLEQLGFVWNVKEYKWNIMYQRLVQFQNQHGHVKIPTHNRHHDYHHQQQDTTKTTLDTTTSTTLNTNDVDDDEDDQDLRLWLIFQRYRYHKHRHTFPEHRIRLLESIPGFSWQASSSKIGPSIDDWAKLFDAMRDIGITEHSKPKLHWFDGINPFTIPIKETYTEQDLLDLWNQENDDDEDEGEHDNDNDMEDAEDGNNQDAWYSH